jgi:hypothetical protein
MALALIPTEDASADTFVLAESPSLSGPQAYIVRPKDSETTNPVSDFETTLFRANELLENSRHFEEQSRGNEVFAFPKYSTPSGDRLRNGIAAIAILVGATFSTGATQPLQQKIQNDRNNVAGFMQIMQQWKQRASRSPLFVRIAYMQLQKILHEMRSGSEQITSARVLLADLERAIQGKDIRDLPLISVREDEASSTLYLDWIFPKGSMGFNVESDENESGWFILYEQPDGKLYRRWGRLNGFDAQSVVSQLLEKAL